MADEGSEYKSIEEVRSVLYPPGAAMLDLERKMYSSFRESYRRVASSCRGIGKRSG
jgi:hypothetical protein